MKLLVTGASGLVGTALVSALQANGDAVVRLVRAKTNGSTDVAWNPRTGDIDLAGLEGMDGVVHLAGENIAGGRWTAQLKAEILTSRVNGTRLLAESIAKLKRPPKVLVSSSAIGFYGDRASEQLSETSKAGTGFLADVCKAWEGATAAAEQKGIRVVHVRTGIVLSTAGGALAKMLFPFRMGVGGNIGNGKQYMSWISLADLSRIFHLALHDESLCGPVNGTAPTPVTNAEFTRALGHALHRPTIFPMPAFAARLVLGEMADALLLASTRVLPAKLSEKGFLFQDKEIETTLKKLVG